MKKWYASKKVLTLVLGFFLLSIIGGYVAINKLFLSSLEEPVVNGDISPNSGLGGKRINVLLLATDGGSAGERTRTDTIMLASLDLEQDKVTLLSVPRDTRVNLPGYGYDKINAAHVYGDVALTKKVVSELLGLPIHYHLLINFEGFIDVIDTLGGIEIKTDKRLVNKTLSLAKGTHHLDGKTALEYVRFRSDKLGDIGRTQRQQQILKTLADQIFQFKTIAKLPKLISQFQAVVKTDMSYTTMVKMANFVKKVGKENLVSQTLPGNFLNYKGISYWNVEEEKAESFVQELLATGKTTDPVDPSVVFSLAKENRQKELSQAEIAQAEKKEALALNNSDEIIQVSPEAIKPKKKPTQAKPQIQAPGTKNPPATPPKKEDTPPSSQKPGGSVGGNVYEKK